jgi:hypothetical protein
MKRNIAKRTHVRFGIAAIAMAIGKKDWKTHRSLAVAIQALFWDMWQHSRSDEQRALTVELLLWVRDARHGMGFRKAYRDTVHALVTTDKRSHALVRIHLNNIPEVGRWDDLTALFGTPLEQDAADLWVAAIKAGDTRAAKWAKRGMVPLQRALGTNEAGLRWLLRSRRDVDVEQLMCAHRWDEIDYSALRQPVLNRYHKAFMRHDTERFQDFLAAQGDSSVPAPHERAVVASLESLLGASISPTPFDDLSAQSRLWAAPHLSGDINIHDLAGAAGGCAAVRRESGYLVQLADEHGECWDEMLRIRRDSNIRGTMHVALGLDRTQSTEMVANHFGIAPDSVRRQLNRFLKRINAEDHPLLAQFLTAALEHLRPHTLGT